MSAVSVNHAIDTTTGRPLCGSSGATFLGAVSCPACVQILNQRPTSKENQP